MSKDQKQIQTVKTEFKSMNIIDFIDQNNKTTDERTLEGLGILYGETGSGKSFVALDIACAVAQGISWQGLKTVQGKVVYILAEGAFGFPMRIKAYSLHNNIDRPPIYIIKDRLSLHNSEDLNDLIRFIQEMGGVTLLIFDSLFSTTDGDYEDTNLITTYCKKLKEQTGATVLMIHDSHYRGLWNFEIKVKQNGDLRSLTITTSSCREDSQEFGFKLARVFIGKDNDMDDITSCVFEPTGALPGKGKGKG